MPESSGTSQSLAEFVSSLTGEGALRVEERLSDGYVRLRVAEAERRQAKQDIRCVEDAVIELLRNSRDAGAKHIYLATSRDSELRSICVLDDGSGVPHELHDKIFEARVTSKLDRMREDKWGVHGRGMALYSIYENAQEARVCSSDRGLGCALRVIFDTESLPERHDQSTWPIIVKDDEDGSESLRGPHNILRACAEFALQERKRVVLYLGSAAEIIATIRSHGMQKNSATVSLFEQSFHELPVCERLCAASSAQELLELASELGMSISERTAHRIMANQIAPKKNVLEQVSHIQARDVDAEQDPMQLPRVDLIREHRRVSLSESDKEAFILQLEKDFDYLAKRYYLSPTDRPRLHFGNGRLSVSFDFDIDE